MSDETSTAVAEAPAPSTQRFDDPFGGSPSDNAIMETLSAEMGRLTGEPEPVEPEAEGVYEEEVDSAEEMLAALTGQKKAEPEVVAEEAPVEDPFDAVLANLNELAGKVLGAQATPAPAVVEPAPEAPPVVAAPVLPTYAVPMDADELLEVITDPQKHAEYMNAFAQKVQMDTMQQMQQAMFAASFEAIHAERYAEEVAQKYPKAQAEAGNLVILAYQQAKQKFPHGTYREIADEANKSIGAVMSKKASIEKSGVRKDVRGRFAPAQASRTSRPTPGTPKADPTQEAFGMINALSAGPGSELLSIFGS